MLDEKKGELDANKIAHTLGKKRLFDLDQGHPEHCDVIAAIMWLEDTHTRQEFPLHNKDTTEEWLGLISRYFEGRHHGKGYINVITDLFQTLKLNKKA